MKKSGHWHVLIPFQSWAACSSVDQFPLAVLWSTSHWRPEVKQVFFLVSLTSTHKTNMFCRHFECIWTNLIDSWLVDDVPGMSCIAEGAQSLIVAAAGWRDSWRKTNLRINSSGTATNTNNSPLWITYLQPWWFWSCHPDCLWEARWGQSPCREWSSACARCPTESWTGCPRCSLHPHWAHC